MIVISLGGSIVVPDEPDVDLIVAYHRLFRDYTAPGRRVIVVVGGGAPARTYQRAYRDISERLDAEGPAAGLAAGSAAGSIHADAQDWIGITATRLNAELLRHALGDLCHDPVVYDPTAEFPFTGAVLVGAGWKPGFSTDYDAVVLAERFGADTVVNLSNISQVHTADPKTDPEARPLESVSWSEFHRIVGTEWKPGSNLPFDPVATKRAAELGLRVIAANGRDIANTRAILEGEAFFGTTIGPG
jgi:uridylate kinase